MLPCGMPSIIHQPFERDNLTKNKSSDQQVIRPNFGSFESSACAWKYNQRLTVELGMPFISGAAH